MKKLLLITVTVFIAGCGEKVQRKSDTPAFWTKGMFENKAAGDVLKLKYNKATLTCRLWTQATAKINLNLPATDVATWDLLKNSAPDSSFTLNGTLKNHEVTATITLVDLQIAKAMELTDKDTGHRYFAPYSPVLTIQTQIAANSTTGKLVGQSITTSLRSLLENSAEMAAYSVHKPSTADKTLPFHDYVECSLQTTIKPELKEALQAEPPPL